VQDEQYDFVTPKARAERDPVKAFRALLDARATRDALRRLGMKP
jgi:molybdate-binding protein